MAITEGGRTISSTENKDNGNEGRLQIEQVDSHGDGGGLPPASDPHNHPAPQPSVDANVIPANQDLSTGQEPHQGVEGRNEPPGGFRPQSANMRAEITDPSQVPGLSSKEIEYYRNNPVMFQNYLQNTGKSRQLQSVVGIRQVQPDFGSRARRMAARHPGGGLGAVASSYQSFNAAQHLAQSLDMSYGELKAERFFAGYMDQLFHIHPKDDTTLKQAVTLVHALRRLVVGMIRQRIAEQADTHVDPFFQGQNPPSMEAALLSDKSDHMRETVPLGDYLHRLSTYHANAPIEGVLTLLSQKPLQGSEVLVGVSKDAEEQDHHYVLLPSQEDLIKGFESGSLQFQTGPLQSHGAW